MAASTRLFLTTLLGATLAACAPSEDGYLTVDPTTVTAEVGAAFNLTVETAIANPALSYETFDVSLVDSSSPVVEFIEFTVTDGFGELEEQAPATALFAIRYETVGIDTGVVRLRCAEAGTATVGLSAGVFGGEFHDATVSVTCGEGGAGSGVTHINGEPPTDEGNDCYSVPTDTQTQFVFDRPAASVGETTADFTIQDAANTTTQRLFFLIDSEGQGTLEFAPGPSVVLREFVNDWELSILGENTTERATIQPADMGPFPVEATFGVVWDGGAQTATASLTVGGDVVAEVTNAALGAPGGSEVGMSLMSSQVCVEALWPTP